jgi:hypothetical protein
MGRPGGGASRPGGQVAVLLLRFWRTALFLSLCALISVVLLVLVTVAGSTIHRLHII